MYQAKHERYQFAEQLYCFTDKTIQEIADITDIPARSLYDRARKYNWTTLRRASRRSPAIMAEEMYRELSDLTASISNRPEGQRIPTPQEAELRRKIIYSIAAIKKFPTHAEASFLMQSLIRYAKISSPISEEITKLVEGFISHRDFYGYASYQPEHGEDLNMSNEQEMDLLFNAEVDETTAAQHVDEDDIENALDRTPTPTHPFVAQLQKEEANRFSTSGTANPYP